MKEPTEGQIKEFWERYRPKDQGHPFTMHYPPTDLNSLVEYAVPMAIKRLQTDIFQVTRHSVKQAREELFRLWLKYCEEYEIEDALFWALWEGSNERD